MACGHRYQAFIGSTIVDPDAARCPKCFGRELRREVAGGQAIGGQGLEQRIEQDMRDPATRAAILENKKWLESPEMQAKRESGEVTVKETGPRHLRPAYEPRRRYY